MIKPCEKAAQLCWAAFESGLTLGGVWGGQRHAADKVGKVQRKNGSTHFMVVSAKLMGYPNNLFLLMCL